MQIRAKIASTPSERELGFQGRKNINEDEGILFVFPQSQKLSFWMLNTPTPLDIAFINKNNRINQISSLVPYSTKIVTSNFESMYALELKQGQLSKNNIEVGDIIEISKDYVQAANGWQGFKNIFIKKKKKSLSEDDTEGEDPTKIIEEKKENLEEKKEDIDSIQEDRTEDEILPHEIEEYQDQNIKGKLERPAVTAPEAQEKIQDKQEEFPDTDPLDLNSTIQEILDYADIHGLNLKMLYRNSHGTILPEKILSPIDNKEYLFFKGPNGSYFKAFDNCATIYGNGWTIQGNKIKSFLFSRIIDLEILM